MELPNWVKFVSYEPDKSKERLKEPWPLFNKGMARLGLRRAAHAERERASDAADRFAAKVWNEADWMGWYKAKYPNDQPVGVIENLRHEKNVSQNGMAAQAAGTIMRVIKGAAYRG